MLDYRGNKYIWNIREKIGNRHYYPPLGFIGFGLKVIDCYEENNWLGINNSPGEWCVAYHREGIFNSPKEIDRIICNIVNSGFKIGPNQFHLN